MNKFWTVFAHTYLSKLKSKAFIITTVIVLVVLSIISNIDKIIDMFAGDETKTIAVIDRTDEVIPILETMTGDEENFDIIPFEGNEDAGMAAVRNEDVAALLVLDKDEANIFQAVFYENKATSDMQTAVETQLQQIKIQMATEQAGIDAATFANIYKEAPFETVALDEAAKTEEELSGTRGMVYVMLFVLYFMVMFYGQMIATEVATEKSSRVMEILISSASPLTHMFGKIIGVGLLGLTQIIVFMIAGYLFVARNLKELSGEFFEVFGFSSISVSTYVYALVFFLLGYFLYATISAMLGSLVSRVEDAQQAVLPVTFLVMAAFFIAVFGLSVPDAMFITVTSFIPFFSPMIMFLRVGMIEVPIWEVMLSIGILVATIYLFAVIGARVYRGGVLMYGGSRSIKDIKSALLLSKKE